MGSGYEMARAIELLVAAGHPPDVAWSYTPRQLAAWAELSTRRKSGEYSTQLSLNSIAAHADAKLLKSSTKKLTDESR